MQGDLDKRHHLDELKLRLEKLSEEQKLCLAQSLQLEQNNISAKLCAYITTKGQKALASSDIDQFASEHLPKHFVPQKIIQVARLPRTSAGKLQRNNLHSVKWETLEQHSGNEIDIENEDDIFDIFGTSDYAAPSNDIEHTLARIWSEVLGVEDISIHDEFLEVGGDSLLSIRILARINKAGLSIRTEDFFQYPTIAGQAKAIQSTGEHVYEVGSTKGRFPLLPIQKWLFERVEFDCHYWNQSVLLEVDASLDFASLQRAWQMLLLHHDALRLAIQRLDEGPKITDETLHQEYLALSPDVLIEKVCLPNDNLAANMDQIETHCNRLNQSMVLDQGNLAKLLFFDTKNERQNYTAIIIHHAIVDAESWRIILEDLQTCWQNFAKHQTVQLPKKTSSYKHWIEKLVDYAQSSSLQAELPFWLQQTSNINMPLDMHADKDAKQLATINTQATRSTLCTKVDIENAALVLSEASKHLDLEGKDFLIAAIVQSLSEWSGQQEILLDIEGHGREELFDKVDISRTVGWFTSVYPVLFSLDGSAPALSIVKSVSATLAKVPNKGIGHGILREYEPHSRLKEQSYSQVCFNFLGNVSAMREDKSDGKANENALRSVSHNLGQSRSGAGKRAFFIEVNARIEKGELLFDWSYSQALHKQETIERLAQHVNDFLLQALAVAHHADKSSTDSSEQDDLFELSDLNMDEMYAISKALGSD